MYIFHKEVRIGGKWVHLDTVYVKGDDIDWELFHRHGDTFGRRYSSITELDIKFHQPECLIHHWASEALLRLNTAMGRKFGLIFGFWPWDGIDAWFDANDRNSIVSDYGITDVRMIGWKV